MKQRMKRCLAALGLGAGTLLLLLAPRLAGAQAYSGPITIDDTYVTSHGGTLGQPFTVTGNWQSTSATPVITLVTSTPVVITGSSLTGPGNLSRMYAGQLPQPDRDLHVLLRHQPQCQRYGQRPIHPHALHEQARRRALLL